MNAKNVIPVLDYLALFLVK